MGVMTDTAPAGSTEETQPLTDRGSNRSQRPASQAFRDFIATGWASPGTDLPVRSRAAGYTARRRAALVDAIPGARLVIPAGGLKLRSNDTDYRFRPHTAFAHLTGLGADREPDSVLVIEPDGAGALYFKPRAGRDTEEFYADARYGELWVGARPTLEEVEAELGLECRHIDELPDAAGKDVGEGLRLLVIPDADAAITDLVETIRAQQADAETPGDAELVEVVSEMRLIKDDFEIEQLRLAIAITVEGFEDVAAALSGAVGRRGERVIETAFEARARRYGNGVGYDTIAAAGPHACTLHWIRNDGPVAGSDLVLVDAGVEVESLYTADITRTLPVSGRFSEAQAKVYQAVLDAADAGFAVARPGARFRDVHDAAMHVLAHRLADWGLLPVSAEQALDVESGGQHRRWMVHGTSHHLGMDVHDCAQARREMYLDAELRPGMVFTIEPGLYFKTDDLLAPEELRGIGVRIEDDVLVTADGCENLSTALPRTIADVEAWMRKVRTTRR